MVKLEFKNAVAKDSGYGLEVNGKSLEDTISTALGTKLKGKGGYNSGLPEFYSNCCDITVIIDPKPTSCEIEIAENVWNSIKDMEDDLENEHKQEVTEADPEE